MASGDVIRAQSNARNVGSVTPRMQWPQAAQAYRELVEVSTRRHFLGSRPLHAAVYISPKD